MRLTNVAACAAVLLAAGAASAAEIVSKPIDTDALVRRPSAVAANLASSAIKLAGNAAAATADNNKYVSLTNFLLGKRTTVVAPTQPNGLPAPGMYPSTRYRSYNTPVAPTTMQWRR